MRREGRRASLGASAGRSHSSSGGGPRPLPGAGYPRIWRRSGGPARPWWRRAPKPTGASSTGWAAGTQSGTLASVSRSRSTGNRHKPAGASRRPQGAAGRATGCPQCGARGPPAAAPRPCSAHPSCRFLPRPGLKRGRRRRRLGGPPPAAGAPSSTPRSSSPLLLLLLLRPSGRRLLQGPAAAAADAAAPAGAAGGFGPAQGASRPRRRGSPPLDPGGACLLAHRREQAVATARSRPPQSLWFRAPGLRPGVPARPRPPWASCRLRTRGAAHRPCAPSARQGTPQPTPSGQHLSAAGAAAPRNGARGRLTRQGVLGTPGTVLQLQVGGRAGEAGQVG